MAIFETQLLLDTVVDFQRQPHAKIAPYQPAFLEQRPDGVAHKVARDGKTDPFVAARVGRNGRVDPDQLAMDIDEGAAGIAHVDRGIGLDVVLVVVRFGQVPALGADDAPAHRVVEIERVADGEDLLAHLDLVRIAPGERGQIGRVDLQHRDIRRRVRGDDAGRETPLVAQLHFDGLRVFNDVEIGDDIPVVTDDDTGAVGRHERAHPVRQAGNLEGQIE